MNKDSITIAEVEHLAEMSGLRFTDAEKKIMQGEVSGIINLLNECATVETDDVEYNREQSLQDLREDEVFPSLNKETVLSLAPKTGRGYIIVPKVVK
jgi:aspartyl-tRNA(Asn)/glutamyl-tRNA(Gln) amidotransferase subunit C